MAQQAVQAMKYRGEIDGLRAFAVVPVVLFHAGFSGVSGGYVGVDVFFVISGYLITTILMSELASGKFSVVNFYERRARRILPALFLVMALCIPVAWMWMLPQELDQFAKSVVAVSVYASNVLFWRSSGYFESAAELKPLLHTWSLAVEEQYYLFFPLMLAAAWRLGRRWIVLCLALLALGSLWLAQQQSTHSPDAAYYLLPTRGWELLAGSLCAFYYPSRWRRAQTLRFNEWGGWAGMGMILSSVFVYDRQTPFPGIYAVLPVAGTALVVICASGQTRIGRLLSMKGLVGLGLISYSTYLWHQPLFAFARLRFPGTEGGALLGTLAVLSFVLAYFSWKYVEVPFRDRQRFSRATIFGYSAVASVAFIAFGWAAHGADGFPNRFDAQTLALIRTSDDGRLPACQEVLESVTGQTCRIGADGVAPSVALLGDSHAVRLTRSLSEELRRRGLSAVVYSRAWCPPLMDVATDNPRKFPNCRAYRKNTFPEVLQNERIRVVMVTAEWPLYIRGQRGREHDLTYYSDAESRALGVEENVKVVRRGLDRTLEALSVAGKKVVLMGTLPEYGENVPYLLAKNRIFGEGPGLAGFEQSVPDYRARNQEFFEMMADLDRLHEVSVVDMEGLFCASGVCRFMDDQGVPLYFDDNHLTRSGADWVVSRLTAFLPPALPAQEFPR